MLKKKGNSIGLIKTKLLSWQLIIIENTENKYAKIELTFLFIGKRESRKAKLV